LVVREGLELPALIYGGGQESGRRSGTENVAGIVGLSRALELAVAERAQNVERVGRLRERLEAGIDAISDTHINGREAPRLPNISNVSFADVDSEALLARLDLAGIAVSAGSACTAGALEPSHVVAALGAGERWQRGVIRFSLGRGTDEAQIDRVLQELSGIVRDLRL
jgi:cysteine desulfurase